MMSSADSPSSSLSLVSPSITLSSRPFSISLSKSKASDLSAPLPFNTKKRPHSSLQDESDSDHGYGNHGPQLVSSFDHSAGGAISLDRVAVVKGPLVIQGQKNRNWLEESRRKRGKNLLPGEEQAAREGRPVEVSEVANAEPQAFGLSFVKKDEIDGDVSMINVEAVQPEKPKPKTADEEALEALMGEKKTKTDLILLATGNEDNDTGRFRGRATEVGMSEDDLFRSDVASRPDPATLEDYAAVPIEEFGAALLRGMGWKEGDVVGKRKDGISKLRILERRPALLGIGAKEVPDDVEELGAWGKAVKGNKRKSIKTFSPILLKNTKTGEMLTEEELKAKLESQGTEEEDWRKRKERNLAIDENKKAERKYMEERRSYRSERPGSSHRERSRSSNRRRDRRKEGDDYERRDRDSERDREKDRLKDDEKGDSRISSRHRHRSKRDYEDRAEESRSSRHRGDRAREEEFNGTRSRRRQEVY